VSDRAACARTAFRFSRAVNMKPLQLYLLLFLALQGCVSHESLIAFEEGVPTPDTEDILNQLELQIQPNDLLRITVHSFSPEAAAPFNIDPVGNQQGGQMMNQRGDNLELFMGYFVDQAGNIDFPVVGEVHLGGLTIDQAKNKIAELVKPYLRDAVVNMRFLNFKVTVTGEVNAPGVVSLTNQRVTLIEALGMAGDLTDYASLDNVLIIREQDGERSYARLDLQDYRIFESPYFYLQQNDVVYVEPQRVRTATVADPAQRLISYGSGLVSIVTLIIAITN